MRLLLAFLAFYISVARAGVYVASPLDSQLPQIAHVGQPYTWALAANTFADDSPAGQAPPPLAYTASGLPAWAHFDGQTHTFTGTPDAANVNGAVVTVTATSSDGSASSSFTLLSLQDPAPTVAVPVAQQLLSGASSLGSKNILPGNVLHIPLGWSFSIGFEGDTFTLPNHAAVYMSATVNGSQSLPSWLTWSSDTFTLYGVAPTQPGAYDFALTGSNRAGYGGTTESLRILVSAHVLTLNGMLRMVNATVGDYFRYQIPITALELDGRQNINSSNPISVSANISDFSWMKFDQTTAILSGSPPFEDYGSADSMTAVVVPITYSDSFGNKLPANVTVNLAPFAFTQQSLPNVIVPPGNEVSVSLASFVRGSAHTNSTSLTVRQAPSSNVTADHTYSAAFESSNTTSWLSFDRTSLLLTGKVPAQGNTMVKVLLRATSRATNQTSTAMFYLASSADLVPGSGTSGKPGKSSNNAAGGLSSRAKIALAASLGGVGGLLALIALMICCRRYVAKEAHDRRGALYDDSDEHTLTDEPQFKKAIVLRKGSEAMTPSTLAASPFVDPEKKITPQMLQSVVIEDPNGQIRDATQEAEEPTQSRLMTGLFATRGKNANKNAGLGLSVENGLGGVPQSRSDRSRGAGQIDHSHSRNSVRSSRSSWEEDLFYEDASTELPPRHSLLAPDDANDVPRRRSSGNRTTSSNNGLTVRHRAAHTNQSPAFHAQDTFTPPEEGTGSTEDINDAYGGQEEYHDSRAGMGSHLGSGDVQIMEAKVMQVRRHSPMMHSNNNPFSQATARSADAVENRYSGAFEDAEDEDPFASRSQTAGRRQHAANVRASTLSAMTDSSQMQAVRAHYANEAAASRQQDVFSPNPSFMDGASLSGYEPQDTMRVVVPRPRTPPSYLAKEQQQQQRQSPTKIVSPASKFLKCPNVPAIVNYPVRFHIFPNVPPPMAGAPGSPGKRSGEALRYALVVNDARPHLSSYRLTWPDMLADWLTFNDATFEAFGIVPDNAGLEELGDIEIALTSSKKAARVPPSPQLHCSPSKRSSRQSHRNSTVSIDSSHTVIQEEDITIVARARLVFRPGPQAF